MIKKQKASSYLIYTEEVLTQKGSYLGFKDSNNAEGLESGIYADNKLEDKNAVTEFNIIETDDKDKKCYTIKGYYPKDGSTFEKDDNNSFYLTVNEKDNSKIDFISSKNKKNIDDNAKWILVSFPMMKDYYETPYTKDINDVLKDKNSDYVFETDATFLLKDQGITISKVDGTPTNTIWIPEGINYKEGTESNGKLKDEAIYWHGIITGEDTGTGIISQKVKIYKEGWYKITCDGFFFNNKCDGKAYLFANDNKVALKSIDKNEIDQINIGKALHEGKYNNSLFIYMDEDSEMKLGIEASNTTAEDKITFDNFTISYFGPDMFVLDEKEEDNTNFRSADESRKQPLLLKKSFDIGNWNSFCLPIDLTKEQFLETFGSDATLAYLDKFDITEEKKDIHFSIKKPANTEDGEIFMKRNTGYLIKTFNPGMTEYIDNIPQQIYLINNAIWKEEDIDNVEQDVFTDENTENAITNQSIKFVGTYWNHTDNNKPIPANSYELKTGNKGYGFYHYIESQNVEGFRCWIQDNSNNNAKINFSFGNYDSTTAISDVKSYTVVRNATYNLEGQKVTKDYKGIIIKNGQKYMSK